MYCGVILCGFAIIHDVLLLRGCASKTNVMLNENDTTSTVAVDGNIVEKLHRYVYLGKMVTRVGDLLPEIKRRIALGCRAGVNYVFAIQIKNPIPIKAIPIQFRIRYKIPKAIQQGS